MWAQVIPQAPGGDYCRAPAGNDGPQMNRTGVIIVLVGVLVVWFGVRSLTGYRFETEHLHAGQFQSITCDHEDAVAGAGSMSPSADFACQQERDDQRDRAPWWIAVGLVVTAYGVIDARKSGS